MKPGKLIKLYREQNNFTQKELAEKLGYSIPQFISLLENGHSSLPLGIVNKLIIILNIPKNIMINSLKEEYEEELNKVFRKAFK